MSANTVLVIDEPGAIHLKPLEVLQESTHVIVSNDPTSLLGSIGTVDVILNGISSGHLLRDIFPYANRLRWVHTLSAGLEKILFPDLVKSSVVLTNARGVFKDSLAEFVIASTLFFAKGLRRLVGSQDAGRWEPFQMEDVKGLVMGIVGYGEIGKACAQRAHALGMKILGLRRRPELSKGDPWMTDVFGPGQVCEMLRKSDYVVLAAPRTPLTRKLIGETEFTCMKSTAVLINVGRGWLVDEDAMIGALERGSIRGAALDVFATEPLPSGHPFFRLKNLLLSPHCADQTSGFLDRDVQFFVQNFQKFLRGEPLDNVVDKLNGY